jgi:hypothetical protein
VKNPTHAWRGGVSWSKLHNSGFGATGTTRCYFFCRHYAAILHSSLSTNYYCSPVFFTLQVVLLNKKLWSWKTNHFLLLPPIVTKVLSFVPIFLEKTTPRPSGARHSRPSKRPIQSSFQPDLSHFHTHWAFNPRLFIRPLLSYPGCPRFLVTTASVSSIQVSYLQSLPHFRWLLQVSTPIRFSDSQLSQLPV